MAKNYEEYAEKYGDPLQTEITEAAENTEDRQAENPQTELPERFQGKSAEEIAASYTELEKSFSQQGNDLGVLRKTVDEFMTLQSNATPEPETPEIVPVTVDDIYEDPDAAVRRVVQEETRTSSDKIAQLEAALSEERYNSQLTSLDGKYDGWRNHAGSEKFREWVQASPYRKRMAQAAEGQDISAADDLMGLWYETQGVENQRVGQERDAQLRDASLESGGPVQPEMVDSFSRAELMDKRIAAKRGDQDAIAYMAANAEAIAIAYEGGHITD